MKLLEKFMNVKLKFSRDNPEWLMLILEEFDFKR